MAVAVTPGLPVSPISPVTGFHPMSVVIPCSTLIPSGSAQMAERPKPMAHDLASTFAPPLRTINGSVISTMSIVVTMWVRAVRPSITPAPTVKPRSSLMSRTSIPAYTRESATDQLNEYSPAKVDLMLAP